MSHIRIFVSHSHADRELARCLVRAIEESLNTPDRSIRCSSVPGYDLNLGSLPADQLRQELGTAEFVLAILTPNSLKSPWVLFELGAVWANAKRPIPLLAGRVDNLLADMPEPLRDPLRGHLKDVEVLHQLVEQLAQTLGWSTRDRRRSNSAIQDLSNYAKDLDDKLDASSSLLKAANDFIGVLKMVSPFSSEGSQVIRNTPGEIEELRRRLDTIYPENLCYIDQFTAQERPSLPSSHISIFGNSRALQGNKEIWSHTETLTQQAIFRWFDVDALKEYIELDELSQQWSTLFDKKVHVWEGIRGIVKVENHPYIKEMYPFILVGQTDKDKLWVNDDSRMYIILLFCAWAYKLCSPSKSLRSETTTFSIKNFTVTSSYVHLHGSFSFKDIKVTSLKKEFTKTKHEYKLDRHIFAAYSGSKICTVMTGVPHPADAESEYIKHVREWLNEFRLGRS